MSKMSRNRSASPKAKPVQIPDSRISALPARASCAKPAVDAFAAQDLRDSHPHRTVMTPVPAFVTLRADQPARAPRRSPTMTPQDVLKLCQDKQVQFIDLRFMDFPGL